MRGLIQALVAISLLFVGTQSVRADYDPSKCPEAQRAEAMLASIPDAPIPDAPAVACMSPTKLQAELTCVTCCVGAMAVPGCLSGPLDWHSRPFLPVPATTEELPMVASLARERPPRI
jgi:hypothetical protein